jgi:hypothetical protein
MNTSHLTEGVSHDDCEKCTEDVADQNPRSRNLDRYSASQEQSHADRAANRDHHELPAGESSVESLFLIDVY